MCEICSKLTIKTPERPYWRRSGVFIVNFEQILWNCSGAVIVDFEQVNTTQAYFYLPFLQNISLEFLFQKI